MSGRLWRLALSVMFSHRGGAEGWLSPEARFGRARRRHERFKDTEAELARKSVVGVVQGVAVDAQRLWVNVKGVWYVATIGAATNLMYAMAVDARKSSSPLLLVYDDLSYTIEFIQTI